MVASQLVAPPPSTPHVGPLGDPKFDADCVRLADASIEDSLDAVANLTDLIAGRLLEEHPTVQGPSGIDFEALRMAWQGSDRLE